MKPISLYKRERIFALLQEGLPSRTVAAREKISHVSVLRIKKLKEKTGGFNVVPRPGRPRILTVRHDRNIARLIKSGECSNAVQVQKKLISDENIIISPNTVRRSLKRQGLVARVKKRKPLLLKRHRIARRKFAQKYRNWTIEDWRRVVWSDESKFMIFGSDGREWCWKEPNSPLKPQHVKPTVKFGGGSVMVWGCMGEFGIGRCCKIEGRMNGELYREILEDEFMGTLSDFDLNVDDVIFQQDNDPKHTANKTYEWFDDNNVEILDWPA
jgi:transposase